MYKKHSKPCAIRAEQTGTRALYASSSDFFCEYNCSNALKKSFIRSFITDTIYILATSSVVKPDAQKIRNNDWSSHF